MKIFVSGKIGAETEPGALMRKLEGLGHTITFDWTTIPHLRPYEVNDAESAHAAVKEVEGVKGADVLVLVSHDRGVGMFVELGVALGLGKRVFVISRPPARTMFFFHPLVTIVPDVPSLLAAISTVA